MTPDELWNVLDTLPYLELVVGVTIVVTAWHLYLDSRQLKASSVTFIKLYDSSAPTNILSGHLAGDQVAKATTGACEGV